MVWPSMKMNALTYVVVVLFRQHMKLIEPILRIYMLNPDMERQIVTSRKLRKFATHPFASPSGNWKYNSNVEINQKWPATYWGSPTRSGVKLPCAT